ncbi:elongation of very long chain fatty acids protein 1-like [Trichogramma pretiosum]|uniref:elongation of very long chain fatty acids protein 1-like n=1 Tax=Trichogramma pretiosum TaxID=7493 RepID=UPI0006C98170|nr:elongation of very long chain fatty acids protein 1-like [Trichogramma pretiosum]XP_014236372.1 elongation of very long chain fatty acids protein 1-like [Trichogramma pretiosum]XP_023316272.1 elongation of very long chain fatty acids protein 1-like [Trichogramma pretiosum]
MNLTELYHHYNVQLADPRTNDMLLVGDPILVVGMLVLYAYIVLKWGPLYMETRKPYSLKGFIFYYNIFQIVSNAIIVYTLTTSGWTTEFGWGCEPVRYTRRPIDWRMVNIVHWTLMLKIIDLIETVVFVLRKKNNQISFLHVYHHISTVVVTYVCTKYFPGGMLSMQMIVNGSVHMIMYTYYLLASLGPKMQPYINPIKPHITKIQIIQFLLLLTHQSQAFSSSCDIPKIAPTIIVGNLLLNLALFLNFYRQSYSAKKIE